MALSHAYAAPLVRVHRPINETTVGYDYSEYPHAYHLEDQVRHLDDDESKEKDEDEETEDDGWRGPKTQDAFQNLGKLDLSMSRSASVQMKTLSSMRAESID